MNAEIDRRVNYTTTVLDLFLARPCAWIDVRTLAEIGGFAAWRSRVSDARQIVNERRSGVIEWNNQIKSSAYRYVPVVAPTRSVTQESLPWE